MRCRERQCSRQLTEERSPSTTRRAEGGREGGEREGGGREEGGRREGGGREEGGEGEGGEREGEKIQMYVMLANTSI